MSTKPIQADDMPKLTCTHHPGIVSSKCNYWLRKSTEILCDIHISPSILTASHLDRIDSRETPHKVWGGITVTVKSTCILMRLMSIVERGLKFFINNPRHPIPDEIHQYKGIREKTSIALLLRCSRQRFLIFWYHFYTSLVWCGRGPNQRPRVLERDTLPLIYQGSNVILKITPKEVCFKLNYTEPRG